MSYKSSKRSSIFVVGPAIALLYHKSEFNDSHFIHYIYYAYRKCRSSADKYFKYHQHHARRRCDSTIMIGMFLVGPKSNRMFSYYRTVLMKFMFITGVAL